MIDVVGTPAAQSANPLLKAIEGFQAKRLHLIPVYELLTQPKPINWLIRGYLEANSISLLYGEPASGKSLVAIDWAARIATGTQWIDAKVKRDSVVVLAGEGHSGISRRLKAWQLKHGVTLDGAGLHVSSVGASLDTPQGLADVVNALDSLPSVGLLIIDTMHRNFAGDENSASDVGVFIANIDALRNRYACTVLIVHHSGHGSDKRARGSSSLKAAVDTSYRLDLNGANRQLVCDKNKDAEPPKAKGFALEVIDLDGWHDDEGQTLTSVVLTPQDAPANRDKPLTPNQHLALETMLVIGDSGVHLEEWRTAFYSKHSGDSQDSKKKAFQRARQELKDIGAIDCFDDVYALRVGCGHFEVLATMKWAYQQRLNNDGTAGHIRDKLGTVPNASNG
jgi:KaiC/GvpD/RAD55 family RecA-like ATPase